MVRAVKDTTPTVSNSGFVTDKIPSHQSVLPQLSLRALDLSPLNSHGAGSTGKKAELLWSQHNGRQSASEKWETNERAQKLNC